MNLIEEIARLINENERLTKRVAEMEAAGEKALDATMDIATEYQKLLASTQSSPPRDLNILNEIRGVVADFSRISVMPNELIVPTLRQLVGGLQARDRALQRELEGARRAHDKATEELASVRRAVHELCGVEPTDVTDLGTIVRHVVQDSRDEINRLRGLSLTSAAVASLTLQLSAIKEFVTTERTGPTFREAMNVQGGLMEQVYRFVTKLRNECDGNAHAYDLATNELKTVRQMRDAAEVKYSRAKAAVHSLAVHAKREEADLG